MNDSLHSASEQLQQTYAALIAKLNENAELLDQHHLLKAEELLDEIRSCQDQEAMLRERVHERTTQMQLTLPKPFAEFKQCEWPHILQSLDQLQQVRIRLSELQAGVEKSRLDESDKNSLRDELKELHQQASHPQFPLEDDLVQLADQSHPVIAKVAAAVNWQPPAIVQPPPPPDEPESSDANHDPLMQFWKHLGESEEVSQPKQKSIPADKSQQLPHAPPTKPNPETELGGDATPEDASIFDDFEEDHIGSKRILTSRELRQQYQELEGENKDFSADTASESDTLEQAVPPGDSVFDEWSDAASSTSDAGNQTIRGERSSVVQREISATGQKKASPNNEEVISFRLEEQQTVDFKNVKEYALQAAQSQNRFDRVSFLARLFWELISLGEYAWAYQVSRCLYANVDADLSIPAPAPWLVSLLVMGDRVRLSSGRIARTFDELATRHRNEAREIISKPESAEALLLRAALMRGAVTTASLAAANQLRSFQILPEQTQLYNYCSRIASFAASATGLKLDQYFYRPGAATVEADARAIRSQVIAWRAAVYPRILPYEVATPLFSRAYWSVQAGTTTMHPELIEEWRARQAVQSFVTRLLQPILDNRLKQNSQLEKEVHHLSDTVSHIDGMTRVVLSEKELHYVPGRELYNIVHEAIEFASQWLVLAASYPGMESVLVPQEVNELRDDIDRRQNSVFQELKKFERTHGLHSHRAATTACRRSMDRISQLFHPTQEMRIAEQDPISLLNGVLLKIPGVTLNDDWQCQISPSTLEHQILLSLQQGNVTWEEAFEMQLDAGCYRSARTLMKLDLWTERKRNWMQTQLEERRQDNAESLQALASQIRGKIVESRQLDILNPLEANRLTQQVDRIESQIPEEYRLDQLRHDLNQLWQLMENKRGMELKKMQQKMSRLTGQETDEVGEEQQESAAEQNNDEDEGSDDWALDV